jgi:tripartite-type tricarboxylate transporter receptor subunit TctC
VLSTSRRSAPRNWDRVESPEVRTRFPAADAEIVGSTPEELTRAFHAELKRWSKFVSETGLKLD